MSDISYNHGDDMSPVERAARALCEADGNSTDFVVGIQPMWKSYLPKVQTVLKAIREPNERMAEAGGQVVRYVDRDESSEYYKQDAANVWRLMVDAAMVEFLN